MGECKPLAGGAQYLCGMYTFGRGLARQILHASSSSSSLYGIDPRFSTSMASHDVASNVCRALGRGVKRSKRRAVQWMRKAAENGRVEACLLLAARMYGDQPYAREVGHVMEAAGVATSAWLEEGHHVPPNVLIGVGHWLHKGGYNPRSQLDLFRSQALEGAKYCRNEGCEVMGRLKDFKGCPQCKAARYCGDACQKQDWTTGGHKEKCGDFAAPAQFGVGRVRHQYGNESGDPASPRNCLN